jgi:ribosomal protein S14
MKSRYFRDRNVRLYVKNNEIKTKILRSLLEEVSLKSSLRYKILLQLHSKKAWSSVVRVRNRCLHTQRNRGLVKLTKMSRLIFRKYASQGYLPGIKLSTW